MRDGRTVGHAHSREQPPTSGRSPAAARIEAALHTGRRLDRVSRNSTPLAGGYASATGSFRTGGVVLSRGHNVLTAAVTYGAHLVLVRADGQVVAYAHLPRGLPPGRTLTVS